MITTTPSQRGLPSLAPPPRVLHDSVCRYYRTLLRNLAWPGDLQRNPLRMLGLTGCHRHEGVSTVAMQLAATAAGSAGAEVLLVDANLAWPAQFRLLGAKAGPGLQELVLEDLPPAEVIQPTAVPHLSLLSAGGRGCDEAAVLETPALTDLMDTLRQQFDLVIFDLPPVEASSGALRLAGLLDGVLLVLEAERVRCHVAQRTAQLLTRAQGQVLGAVVNKYQRHIPGWLYRRL